MNFYRDKQIKGFILSLILFVLLLFSAGFLFGMSQISYAKALLLAHDEAIASSLLDQGTDFCPLLWQSPFSIS